MSDPNPDDTRLREAFSRLRAHDARRRPPFSALRRPPPVRPFPRAVVALVPLVAAAVLFVVCGAPSSKPLASSPPIAVSSSPSSIELAADVAPPSGDVAAALPLDFLLEPTFGGPSDSMAFLSRVPPLDLSKGPR